MRLHAVHRLAFCAPAITLLLAGCGTGTLPSASSRAASGTPAAFANIDGGSVDFTRTKHRAPRSGVRRLLDVGGSLPSYTMTILWDVIVTGTNDHMSSPTMHERNGFSSQGQTWYLPANQLSGTSPFYREVDSNDHMDSTVTNEAGYYRTEAALGYVFPVGSVPGTAQIVRENDPALGDHATPSAYDLLSGYTQEPMNGAGFARYDNQLTSFTTLTANGITAQTNAVAGGAFWTWTWNGKQLIDNHDFGRLLQSSLFYGSNPVQNPTEAGDIAIGNAQDFHGSPNISTSVSGTVISTRTMPLEFVPQDFGASVDSATGTPQQAVLYKDVVIGKDVDLNFRNLPGIASYSTIFTLPNALSNVTTEIPTGYMPGTYNQFWIYDAGSQRLQSAPPPQCNTGAPARVPSSQYPSFSGYGGVIISNLDQSVAMGVYARTTAVGGPVSSFAMFDLTNNCPSINSAKWVANYSGSMPAGTTRVTTFVLTGTLSSVTANMNLLKTMGY